MSRRSATTEGVARRPGRRRLVTLAIVMLTAGAAVDARLSHADADPYLDRVRRFSAGEFAGFGQDRMPGVVKGAPHGGGELSGGTDVVSLGHGGSIKVAFRDNIVFDGPGDDFVVFENAFHIGVADGAVFEELAFVSVSADGRHWHTFAFDETSGEGLAGRAPVLANPGNDIDPLSSAGGGDRFDLADLGAGVEFIRFIRIEDAGDLIPDIGDQVVPGDKGGFDLDAAAAINSTAPAQVTGYVLAGGQPVNRARVRLKAPGARVMRRRSRSDGSFRFYPVMPAGDYVVSAAKKDMGRDAAVVFVDVNEPVADADLHLE